MTDEKLDTVENFITIETHFGVPEHFIRADTKNRYSENIVAIIQEIALILYPDDKFEVYLLPSEPGSFKEIIKFVNKHKLSVAAGSVMTIGGLVLGILTYKDSHEKFIHDKRMQIVDDTQKCLELKKNIDNIGLDYTIENISEEKIKIACGSLNLKKRKNDIYNTLKNDDMIENNETFLKDSTGSSVLSKKIEKNEFPEYIELIADQKYSNENVEGIIELISPVLKQKQDGKGMTWRGIYHGENIIFNEISILQNEEVFDFFMQDSDFKTKINNQEQSFKIRDTMKVSFNISGELKNGIIQNRSVYIKEVKSYNEETIPHTEKTQNKSKNLSQNQTTLF